MPEIDLGYVLGPKGDPGEPGRDGTDGTPGAPGSPGADGKSAYQYAKEGGFVGTEEQFYTALAEVVLKMNKVIPRKVDTIATLSAAGQAQDSGKTLADYYTKGETVAKGDVYTKSEVYSKTEADGKFAGTDAFYTKAQTLTAETGQLFGPGVNTPNAAFKAIKNLLDEGESSLSGYAKIVTGSYIGNGKYGESNPNSIAFTSIPKGVIVEKKEYAPLFYLNTDEPMIWVKGSTGKAGDRRMVFTQSGTTLSWYNAESDIYQLNISGMQYNYLAIL